MTNSVIKICNFVHYFFREGGYIDCDQFSLLLFSLFMVGGRVQRQIVPNSLYSLFFFWQASLSPPHPKLPLDLWRTTPKSYFWLHDQVHQGCKFHFISVELLAVYLVGGDPEKCHHHQPLLFVLKYVSSQLSPKTQTGVMQMSCGTQIVSQMLSMTPSPCWKNN